MKKRTFLALALMGSISLNAQQESKLNLDAPLVYDQEHKYATLTNGYFTEVMENKDTAEILGIVFNTKTGEIYQIKEESENRPEIDPVVLLWQMDPKAALFPMMSPYSAMGNNPIYYVDPDGQVIKPASDYSSKVIGDALVQIFKSENIVGKLFDFNNGPNVSKSLKSYGLITSRKDLSFKAFKKAMKSLAKEEKVKFSKTEMQEAFTAYQKINEKAVHEILVVSENQAQDNTEFKNSTGDNQSSTLTIRSEDLNKVVSNLSKIEQNNKQPDENGNIIYNTDKIKQEKADYLNTETNGTGTKTYDSGDSLINDNGNKSKGVEQVKNVLITE